MRITVYNSSVSVSSETSEEASFFQKISDEFSFTVPAARYSPSYRRGFWDGKKRFFVKNAVPIGFFTSLLDFLNKSGIHPLVVDMRTDLPRPVNELKIFSIGSYKFRDYQKELILKTIFFSQAGLYMPCGIIDAATNAGKNLIVAGIYTNISCKNAIFLVHNKTLFKQAFDFFSTLFETGKINDTVFDLKPFTIAMYQSLHNRISSSRDLMEYVNDNVNALFVDECHRTSGDVYSDLLSKIKAPFRIGLSGTPFSSSVPLKNVVVRSHFGPVIGSVSNEQLVEMNVSRMPVVRFLLVKHPRNYTSSLAYDDYETQREEFIFSSPNRTQAVVEIIGHHHGQIVLVYFDFVKHGYHMYEAAFFAFPDRRVSFVYGESPDRDAILDDFKKGRIDVLFASSILKEGFNSTFDVLVFAAGGKSKITTLQTLGRALRAKEGSSDVSVYDFWDESGGYVERHSWERYETYVSQNFIVSADFDIEQKIEKFKRIS